MNKLYFIALFAFVLSLVSCKTPYEKIRTSENPKEILDAANAFYDEEEWVKAQGLYDIVIPFYRGKQEAEDLFYRYAYTYYNIEEYILASHYFGSYAKTFYDSPRKEETEFMEAFAQYEMSPNYRLDQSSSQKAIDAFQRFVNTYPNSERVRQCNALIDEMREKMEIKAYEQGDLYFRLERYQAAITSLENMIKDFPETSRGDEIRRLIIKSNYNLASKSIFAKQEERYTETLKKVAQFKKKYPNSVFMAEIEKIENNSNKALKEISNVRLKESSTGDQP